MKPHPSEYFLLYFLVHSIAPFWLTCVTAEIWRIGGVHYRQRVLVFCNICFSSLLVIKIVLKTWPPHTHTQKSKDSVCWSPLLPGVAVWWSSGHWGWADAGCVAHVSPSFLYHPFPHPGIGDATATMLDRKGWSLRTSWSRLLTSSAGLAC